jgi:hypothetical protein
MREASDTGLKRGQRHGIELLIGAGALLSDSGPMLLPVPTPENPRPAFVVTQHGPCGNPGEWCSEDAFLTLPGWKVKLCASCEAGWRKVVTGQ